MLIKKRKSSTVFEIKQKKKSDLIDLQFMFAFFFQYPGCINRDTIMFQSMKRAPRHKNPG